MDLTSVYRFLEKPQSIDHEILRIRQKIAALRGCLLPQGIRYDLDKVQTSPEDRMSRINAEIADLNARIDALLDDKAEAVRRISLAIESLDDDRERNVLSLYYVGRKTMREIERELHYSKRWTIKLKRAGVTKLSQRVHLSAPSDVL